MPGYEVPHVSELPSTPDHVRDMVLQDLVSVVNRSPPTSFGITLVIGGTVLTGDLIGAGEYFKRYGELWKELLKDAPDVAKTICEGWAALGAKHTAEAEESPAGPFNFVHLRNARVLLATGLLPTSSGLLWRGRISKISGFSIGQLSAPKAAG